MHVSKNTNEKRWGRTGAHVLFFIFYGSNVVIRALYGLVMGMMMMGGYGELESRVTVREEAVSIVS